MRRQQLDEGHKSVNLGGQSAHGWRLGGGESIRPDTGCHLLDKSRMRDYNHPAIKKPAKPGREGDEKQVTKVTIESGESFDSLLRRFNKKVQGDRVMSEVRRRRFFEKPSVIRKRKKAAKLRKSRRQTIKERRYQ